MIARLALAAVAPVALLSATGCGEAGAGSADPVSAAPPDSLVFAEGTIRPTGELKENADAISRLVTGNDEFGAFIVSRLEESTAEGGEPVAPWLGPLAGVYAGRFDGKDFSRGGVILQSTDRAAARRFLDRQPAERRSYRGVEFKVGADSAFGLIGDLVVFADGAAGFRDAVDAAEDEESLSGEARYEHAVADAADDRLAEIYLDLGRMAGQFQSLFGSQALGLLALAAVDPGATLAASVIPHERALEVDVSSSFDATAPGGSASEALEALPGDAIAAAGIPGFGKQLETAIDSLARKGIPGELGPGELKGALRAAGVDLEQVASGLGDAGAFVDGERRLGGALVVEADDPEQARSAVAEVGLFLRRSGTPGVTALGGGRSGFSISDEERLGGRPVVVVTAGARIAIGYGLEAALRGLDTETESLSGSPAFREAAAALGETPIGAFVDGPAALRLASTMTPPDAGEFRKARPYLEKIRSVGFGAAGEGDPGKTIMVINLK